MNPLIEFNHKLFNHVLVESNRRLGNGVDADQILNFIFGSLAAVIPFDRMGIGMLEGPETMKLVWVKSQLPVKYIPRDYAVSIRGSSILEILKFRKSRIISDLRAYAKSHPKSVSTSLIIKDGIRSSLTCPLFSRGKSFGVVFFSSKGAGTYQDEHSEFFSAIANQISILLEQTRLQTYFNDGQARDANLRNILHDFRSPLGTIEGYVELASEQHWFNQLEPEAKRFYEVLKRNTDQLSSLLQDLTELRELSKIDAKAMKEERDLPAFLENMVRGAGLIAGKKNIFVEAHLAADLPLKLPFDICRIQRVLDNLISNAVKFSKRNLKIHIRVAKEVDRIVFEIADQGEGVPEHERNGLFKEFGKTSTRPTEGEPSSGLGLAMAREIVRQHGGEISMSGNIDRGSIFKFWLPIGGIELQAR